MIGTDDKVISTGDNVIGTGNNVNSTDDNVISTDDIVIGTGDNVFSTGDNLISTDDNVIGTGDNVISTGDNVISTGESVFSTDQSLSGSAGSFLSTVMPRRGLPQHSAVRLALPDQPTESFRRLCLQFEAQPRNLNRNFTERQAFPYCAATEPSFWNSSRTSTKTVRGVAATWKLS